MASVAFFALPDAHAPATDPHLPQETTARAQRPRRSPAGSGGVAEWLKAHAWKVCIPETVSRVRIPLPPPVTRKIRAVHPGFSRRGIFFVPAGTLQGQQQQPAPQRHRCSAASALTGSTSRRRHSPVPPSRPASYPPDLQRDQRQAPSRQPLTRGRHLGRSRRERERGPSDPAPPDAVAMAQARRSSSWLSRARGACAAHSSRSAVACPPSGGSPSAPADARPKAAAPRCPVPGS